MKVYLISQEGKPIYHKLGAWVDIEFVGKNGIYVKSVRAFLKRKEAVAWLKEKRNVFPIRVWSNLKIISTEIK